MQLPSREAAPAAEGVPFRTADEAWIWAVQGMLARLDGARVQAGMASIVRPCEASDVLGSAHRLHQQGLLSATEMRVLFLYGRHAVPPWALDARHRPAVPVWERALCALALLWEQKGIILAEPEGSSRG